MGLDPKATRIAREQAKADQAVKPRLNPPFPFRVLPFDPFFFGLEKDPPRKAPVL